jgi:hypothetical protein
LPAGYFRLMEAGAQRVEARLNAEPEADLAALERQPDWRHFGYAILAPAVLYAKQHPANRRYGDPALRALAIRIGDLLASEDEKGKFEPRLDSDWDAYTWMEAYRLLERELGPERRARWARAIQSNIGRFERDARDRLDFPWYNSPYIGTSPNHYALWAANFLLAGRVFGKPAWEQLGRAILHRFAASEQTADGYWGEHTRSGPATGYNHLTLSAVGLYWELTHDPEALRALRRATDFHKYFTWGDGTPVEVINNRNRRWEPGGWAQFAFSQFPDGRGYAEFLAGRLKREPLSMNTLGRISQDALYYHEGPIEAPPQALPAYVHRMEAPAGIRKSGPWVVCLSGLIDTQAVDNQFYLDRQANLSVFHEKLGLIVSGGNSKRQPELATFSETLTGEGAWPAQRSVFHLPVSSRLEMGEAADRLSLAYNSFWADLFVPRPDESRLRLRFVINGKGEPPEEARLTLQLCLKAGEVVETGAGRRFTAGAEPIALSPEELGGSLGHHGWSLETPPGARLAWPVYPFNPYADGPETGLEYAVAALSVPLRLKAQPGRYVRPQEQEIAFSISAGR